VSQYLLSPITYVPVPTAAAVAGVADRIARERGARVISGWVRAAEALTDDEPAAELVAIAEEAHRAVVHGSTAARAVVAVRQLIASTGLGEPSAAGPEIDAPPAPVGAEVEHLWATRDRLGRLEHRSADIVRIARGMTIAAVGVSLILAGTETVSVPLAIAIGVAWIAVVILWGAWTHRRARSTRRSLNEQLAALGATDRDHLAWLDEWTASWDAAFGEVMAARDEPVGLSAHAREATRAGGVLRTLQELEAAGINAANLRESAIRQWEGALARHGLEPVPITRVTAVIAALPPSGLDPVVIAAMTTDSAEAQRVRELLRRPSLREIWVVAPEVDEWEPGSAS
jgi:hypothetical protein